MASVTLTVYKGDDKSWTVNVTDSDSNAIDLTGGTLFFTVKKNKTDEDANALIRKDVTTHTNATGGVTTLTLTDEDTNLDAGDYYFDLQWVDSGGLVSTWFDGTFRVTQDITRRIT